MIGVASVLASLVSIGIAVLLVLGTEHLEWLPDNLMLMVYLGVFIVSGIIWYGLFNFFCNVLKVR